MDKSYVLWIEETDKRVWHGAARTLGVLRYQAGCGWEMDARRGRLWFVKSHESGPPGEDRCLTCVAVE